MQANAKHLISSWQSFAVVCFMVFGSLSLSGCFKDQPSESDVKAMAEERFNNDFAGIFITNKVDKLNGYKQNDSHYVASVNITATAQQSLNEYGQSLRNNDTLSALEKLTAGMTIGLLKLTMPNFEAGDVLQFERNYLFIKTDNGWMLSKELAPDGSDLNPN